VVCIRTMARLPKAGAISTGGRITRSIRRKSAEAAVELSETQPPEQLPRMAVSKAMQARRGLSKSMSLTFTGRLDRGQRAPVALSRCNFHRLRFA